MRSTITPRAELALSVSLTALLHPTPFSFPESSSPYDLPLFPAEGLSPSSSCPIEMAQPLLHSPAWVCPVPRARLSPQPHPLHCPQLLLSALPPPRRTTCQPRGTMPWGFPRHRSSHIGAFLPFPRSPKHQLSFLRNKRGRNISRCVALCCPCPTLLMRCPSAPWCICTRLGDQHVPRRPCAPCEQAVRV